MFLGKLIQVKNTSKKNHKLILNTNDTLVQSMQPVVQTALIILINEESLQVNKENTNKSRKNRQ